jgi:hypothetical protein
LAGLTEKAGNLKVRNKLIDELYEFSDFFSLGFEQGIAYTMLAFCHSDEERLSLAERFQKVPRDRFLKQMARTIYREAGEDDAYLASRLADMIESEDYHDLALGPGLGYRRREWL